MPPTSSQREPHAGGEGVERHLAGGEDEVGGQPAPADAEAELDAEGGGAALQLRLVAEVLERSARVVAVERDTDDGREAEALDVEARPQPQRRAEGDVIGP